MKNRLGKLSRNACYMMFLLAVSGISTSCKDEYMLDDEKPSWLSSSIYDKLEKKGNYTNYLRLIGDPDVNPTNARPLTEVLSRTGSKTVFAADDDAWKQFFASNALLPESNPWHNATSYDKLSVNQKKLLIHTSMLNNAIVMENLSSSSSDISSRGDFMRRETDVEITDTIAFLDGDSLPINYNEDNGEADYWWRFRKNNGGNGIYLAEASAPMMIHFTTEHLTKNSVTDDDFAKFMGTPRVTSDVHINDARLIEKDSVAENGYLNKTEKVLIPLPSMAEILRTNGSTKIFSHMLDRWSAPYYNESVTRAYKNLMASRGKEWTDSIFTKRYFSTYSLNNKALNTDPKGQELKGKDFAILKFDPSWNTFVSNDNYWANSQKTAPQFDMAAMFVPDDETMWTYFMENGGGWQLIKTYYMKEGTPEEIPYTAPKNLDELFFQIDQIPLGTLESLFQVNMQRSFVGSVPSKLTKLRDDAQEQMFYPEDIQYIQRTLLANNGIIYITSKVFGPTDYRAITAPAFISKTNEVMKYAIYNGYMYKDGKDKFKHTDQMGLNYYAYLKAMQSDFAFFMPSDTAMYYYYDPVSFRSQKSRILHLYYKEASFPIKYNIYAYDPQKGEIGETYGEGRKKETIDDSEIVNRLKDILESHTVVLDDGVKEINSGIDEYYLAKNGAAIKVIRGIGADGKPHVVKVQGGFQIENEEKGITGTISAANKNKYLGILGIQQNTITDEHNKDNGTTYILDSPMIPASRSVYNIFTNEYRNDSPLYNDFYELCKINEKVIRACGLVDESGSLSASQQQTEVKKYSIFIEDNGLDQNIQFFNNYRYTIFVPTSTALNEARAKGLPTWEEIEADYEDMKPIMDESKTLRQSIKDYLAKKDTVEAERLQQRLNAILPIAQADSLILQAKCTYLINFVRYHFADNSIFVDKSTYPVKDFVTASYDNQKGLFCKVNVRRPSSDVLEVQDYSVTDSKGNSLSPWVPITGKYNVMARDYSCSSKPTDKSMKGISIQGSSFAVIHQVPSVLNHTELVNGRHDSQWSSAAAAKKYLKRFAIH